MIFNSLSFVVISFFCSFLHGNLFSHLFSTRLPILSSSAPSETVLPLSADYNKRVVQSNVKQDVLKALVHLKGFSKIQKENTSNAISSVIVIDRSGSMGGAGKLKFAIEGAHCLVDLLTEKDIIGLVIFDDSVERVFETGYATVENKKKLHSIISGLHTGGSTNIYDGVSMGIDMLLTDSRGLFSKLKGKALAGTRRLILLSDGEANVNTHLDLNGLVAKAHMNGITVSSVGLGLDYDERLMQGVAESGGGNYYYVRESQNLPDVFAAEVGNGRGTVTHHTQAYLAYDPRVVQAVDIVGYRTQPADRKDVEHVRQLQRERKAKEEKEKEEKKEKGAEMQKNRTSGSGSGNQNGSLRTGKWDIIAETGIEVLAVNMRDFVADEEREMLIYLNYTTVPANNSDSSGSRAVEPYMLPLASLIVTYTVEDPQAQTQLEGISTLRLDVGVDDDTVRATAANGAKEAVEGQRRVGLAVEYAEANRMHLKAIDLIEKGDYDGADIVFTSGENLLSSWEKEMEDDDDEEGAKMMAQQKERFRDSRKLAREGRASGDPSVQKRMKKASKHFSHVSASGRASLERQSVGSSREKGKIEV